MGSKCLFTLSDNEKEITLGSTYNDFGYYERPIVTNILFTARVAKRAKVMFSQAYVILSTLGGGGGWYMPHNTPTPTPGTQHPPREPWGGGGWYMPHNTPTPWNTTPALPPNTTPTSQYTTPACPPTTTKEAEHQGIRSIRGRYASYWNAFLFLRKEHFQLA